MGEPHAGRPVATESASTRPTERDAAILSPDSTPRSDVAITRRLVGVSRWPLILLTAIYAVNVSDQFLLPSVFPLLKGEFGLSDTQLGLLSGSYLVSVTVLTVPFGTIADRFVRTRVVAWGTAAWGATMVWTGLARGYPSLLASRMLLGAWDPCDNPTSQSLLADYYPVGQRTKVLSVYQIGQLLGILMLPIAGAMATEWGWRSTFFFFSLPAFVVAILAWQLPEPIRGAMDRRHANLRTTTAVESDYDHIGTRAAYRELLHIRTFTSIFVSSTFGSLFFGSIGVWAPTYMVRYLGFTLTEAASATGLFALGGIVGALGSGYVTDSLTRSGHTAARVVVASTMRIVTAPLFFVAFSVDNAPAMLVFFTLGAITLTASQPPLNAARADVVHPSLRGRATSLDAVFQSIAGAAAPVIMGVIADATSLRTAFLVVVPLVAVAGLILLLVALPVYRRDVGRLRDLLWDESRRAAGLDEVAAAEMLQLRDPSEERAIRRRDDVILEIDDLSFSYGPVQVLFGITMQIPRGGCHAILGRNGVGKTTLLSTVAGLLDAQSGETVYDGLELTGIPTEQRVALGITLMAGGRSTFPSLSVSENLWIGGYPFSTEHDLIRDRMSEVFSVFPELERRVNQPGGTLSGGEQQMLALGRALMAGPSLLLIDELSLGLAPRITQELLAALRRVKALGTTIVIVEQSVRTALDIADTVVFMEKGVVHPLGSADGLDQDELAQMMLGAVVA